MPFNTLTQTGKMPGKSFGLPTSTCVIRTRSTTRARLSGRRSICDQCYGERGNYRFHEPASEERLEWTKAAIKDGTFVPTMAGLIGAEARRAGMPYHFRIHDRGDFFSVAYIRAWIRIAEALPGVRFWAPTRAHLNIVLYNALVELNALPNVTIRPSADAFDDPPPVMPGLAAGSSASATAYDCPAHEQGNNCGDCRRCWDEPSRPVTYKER